MDKFVGKAAKDQCPTCHFHYPHPGCVNKDGNPMAKSCSEYEEQILDDDLFCRE